MLFLAGLNWEIAGYWKVLLLRKTEKRNLDTQTPDPCKLSSILISYMQTKLVRFT